VTLTEEEDGEAGGDGDENIIGEEQMWKGETYYLDCQLLHHLVFSVETMQIQLLSKQKLL
jgi:hypothetical protein